MLRRATGPLKRGKTEFLIHQNFSASSAEFVWCEDCEVHGYSCHDSYALPKLQMSQSMACSFWYQAPWEKNHSMLETWTVENLFPKELPVNLSQSFPWVGISGFLSGRMLETSQKYTKESTVMRLKYKSKDYLVFMYCSCFPSCSGKIKCLLFLASFKSHWIPSLFLLLNFPFRPHLLKESKVDFFASRV